MRHLLLVHSGSFPLAMETDLIDRVVMASSAPSAHDPQWLFPQGAMTHAVRFKSGRFLPCRSDMKLYQGHERILPVPLILRRGLQQLKYTGLVIVEQAIYALLDRTFIQHKELP